MQGFFLIPAVSLAPIIPQMGFYGLEYKAFSIVQDTLNRDFDALGPQNLGLNQNLALIRQ